MVRRLTHPRRVARLIALVVLALTVTAIHLGVVERAGASFGALFDTGTRPQRMTALYVTRMADVQVATRQARPVKRPPRAAPRAVVEQEAVGEPIEKKAEPVSSAPEATSDGDDTEAVTPVVAGPADPDESSFDWPGSTRLRYRLSGYVRGEVTGQAQVEWIREGRRYQVHLDVEIGPPLAPLATRRMSSDGILTPEGLQPRYYDQATRFGFALPTRAEMRFDGAEVRLANGSAVTSVPGVQDTVSQFVQLSWMFESDPGRLQIGQTVEMPLALPRRLAVWVYDVVAEETLYTPFGEVLAYHLKPRTVVGSTGDLLTEIWIAPAFRHLPVRFRIHQDTENHIDLLLDERPEMAAKM